MLAALVTMELRGSGLILAVLLLRQVGLARLPSHVFYGMWLVVLVRLLVPWNLSIPISLPVPSPETTLSSQAIQSIQSTSVASLTEPATVPETAAAFLPGLTLLHLAGVLWLVGAGAVLVWFLVRHLRFLPTLRQSLPAESDFCRQWVAEHPLMRPYQLRVSDQIQSPVTHGLLRPRIVLPSRSNLSDAALRLILAHEWVHVRRLDLLVQYLLVLVTALHWYNPLVWGMATFARRDLERSCDALALRSSTQTERKEYAAILLRFSLFPADLDRLKLDLWFVKDDLEERMISIMKKTKYSVLALVLAAALLVSGISAFAAGTPQETEPETTALTAEEADIALKVTVSYGANSFSFYVSANSSRSYTVNNAWAGTTHTLDFSTTDGAPTGTVAVRVSSTAL